MKAQDIQFTQLLEGSKQFIIPIFQRTYSWEKSHCQQLWDDIIRVGANAEINSHFIGSAVYIPEVNSGAAIPRWLVIDGQQRITTMMLLLIAFRDRLRRLAKSIHIALWRTSNFLLNRLLTRTWTMFGRELANL